MGFVLLNVFFYQSVIYDSAINGFVKIHVALYHKILRDLWDCENKPGKCAYVDLFFTDSLQGSA